MPFPVLQKQLTTFLKPLLALLSEARLRRVTQLSVHTLSRSLSDCGEKGAAQSVDRMMEAMRVMFALVLVAAQFMYKLLAQGLGELAGVSGYKHERRNDPIFVARLGGIVSNLDHAINGLL